LSLLIQLNNLIEAYKIPDNLDNKKNAVFSNVGEQHSLPKN